MTDFQVTNHGSIVAIEPKSIHAHEWLEDNVFSESWQWFGSALCIDARLAADIVEGILEEGLSVGR